MVLLDLIRHKIYDESFNFHCQILVESLPFISNLNTGSIYRCLINANIIYILIIGCVFVRLHSKERQFNLRLIIILKCLSSQEMGVIYSFQIKGGKALLKLIMQQAGSTVDSHWAAGGGDNHNSWGEDGGWSQGPKVTGSGWTDTGPSENGQDIGTWHNPQRSDQNWSQTTNSVIVDSTDKEAWPSIRPGETVSDSCDDISSANQSTVITSSTNQGQNINLSNVSSAMQSQSASSPWGAPSTFSGIESNPWGSGNSPSPSASNQNSLGWTSSNPHPSLSVNNQGHNMQTGTSSAGSDNISISKNLNPSLSLGWASTTQGQGVHRPQNSMQLPTSNGNSVHGMLPSISGAQQSGPAVGSSRSTSNPWPSSSFGELSNFSKSNDSGWSTSNAVMNNGASAGKDSRGNNEPNTDSGSSVWGKSSGFGASGWDQNPSNNKPPVSGSQWENGNTKSQWGENPSGAAKSQGTGNNPEQLSWAQAACKGLPPTSNSGNDKIIPEQPVSQQTLEMARVIDCHDGWGRKPVCQNSSWDLEVAKSSQTPRVDDGGAANVWDNNNGTAIWESSRDNQNRVPGGWNGATSGPQWNKDKESNQWSGPGGGGSENNPMSGGGGSEGSIGNWNVPDTTNPNVWGGKTETGSWKDTSSWEDTRQQDGTAHWAGGEMVKPKSWSSTPSTPSTPITPGIIQKEDWNKGVNQVNAPGSRPGGWGNPSNSDRVDDGTSIWAGNAQHQARASGWGDTGSQWNPTVGAKSKSSWDEGDSWNSANRKPDWTDDRGGWGCVDVGYWNDVPNENSTWSSASGWKNKQAVKMPANKFPPSVGFHPNNQMRVRLLEQLVSMGFKKEDAQNALISNNMNYEGALAELANTAKKDNDMDVFHAKTKPGILPDSGLNNISENHLESNPHVPNFPVQNTPFQNAQVPNQPFMSMYDQSKLGNTLPTSSPNPMNSSINPALQPKFMPQQKLPQLQQAPSLSPTQGPMTRSQAPDLNSTHFQMFRQQLLKQLNMAVQSGLISPQLLVAQPLPRNILQLLQQLLECQNFLQQLIKQQVMVQKNKGMQPNQQLNTPMIAKIKQQILNIQKQISQAEAQIKPSQPQNQDVVSMIQTELNSLSINNSTMTPPQPQSRLNQWKTGNGDNDADNLNKAVGSKPMHQSQSSPNLGRFDELSGLNISGDTTWSTHASSTSQNWPSTSEGTTIQADSKPSMDNKESLNLATLTDVIPEFIPGKPWQGFSNKNVEDDPHITPGSFQRSFSVNVVKDDALDNLSAQKNMTSSDWSKSTNSKNWSIGEVGGTDWNSGIHGTSGRQPPGLSLQGNKTNNWQRQNSWAGRTDNSAFTPVGNWDKKAHRIIIKNISQQTDGNLLRTLCLQHGSLTGFQPIPQIGCVIVSYSTKEDAMKAQRALNSLPINNSTLYADFISEEDVERLASNSTISMNLSTTSQWSQNHHQQPQQQQLNVGGNSSSTWSTTPTPYLPTSGSGNMWSSGLWGATADDHNSNPLNILGGQSM
ncbi:hypothetical protein LOTGIDRAFT_155537 [Lottia gigantea]|uniref:UBA domain-containing protein n=1 Tax=Lottia gigantea TaxID=225164 RepID=V4B6M2_LOTGI|nr:hypothetical protein LOTGIDRAFT_155537 [Lottia gigantea]ESO84209.1 hypothetical protein LOTGIDRAFT_155537 [Lottia gigantea]